MGGEGGRSVRNGEVTADESLSAGDNALDLSAFPLLKVFKGYCRGKDTWQKNGSPVYIAQLYGTFRTLLSYGNALVAPPAWAEIILTERNCSALEQLAVAIPVETSTQYLNTLTIENCKNLDPTTLPLFTHFPPARIDITLSQLRVLILYPSQPALKIDCSAMNTPVLECPSLTRLVAPTALVRDWAMLTKNCPRLLSVYLTGSCYRLETRVEAEELRELRHLALDDGGTYLSVYSSSLLTFELYNTTSLRSLTLYAPTLRSIHLPQVDDYESMLNEYVIQEPGRLVDRKTPAVVALEMNCPQLTSLDLPFAITAANLLSLSQKLYHMSKLGLAIGISSHGLNQRNLSQEAEAITPRLCSVGSGSGPRSMTESSGSQSEAEPIWRDTSSPTLQSPLPPPSPVQLEIENPLFQGSECANEGRSPLDTSDEAEAVLQTILKDSGRSSAASQASSGRRQEMVHNIIAQQQEERKVENLSELEIEKSEEEEEEEEEEDGRDDVKPRKITTAFLSFRRRKRKPQHSNGPDNEGAYGPNLEFERRKRRKPPHHKVFVLDGQLHFPKLKQLKLRIYSEDMEELRVEHQSVETLDIWTLKKSVTISRLEVTAGMLTDLLIHTSALDAQKLMQRMTSAKVSVQWDPDCNFTVAKCWLTAPQLRRLSLSFLPTPEDMAHVLEHSTGLHFLSVESHHSLPNQPAKALFNNCPSIRKIQFSLMTSNLHRTLKTIPEGSINSGPLSSAPPTSAPFFVFEVSNAPLLTSLRAMLPPNTRITLSTPRLRALKLRQSPPKGRPLQMRMEVGNLQIASIDGFAGLSARALRSASNSLQHVVLHHVFCPEENDHSFSPSFFQHMALAPHPPNSTTIPTDTHLTPSAPHPVSHSQKKEFKKTSLTKFIHSRKINAAAAANVQTAPTTPTLLATAGSLGEEQYTTNPSSEIFADFSDFRALKSVCIRTNDNVEGLFLAMDQPEIVSVAPYHALHHIAPHTQEPVALSISSNQPTLLEALTLPFVFRASSPHFTRTAQILRSLVRLTLDLSAVEIIGPVVFELPLLQVLDIMNLTLSSGVDSESSYLPIQRGAVPPRGRNVSRLWMNALQNAWFPNSPYVGGLEPILPTFTVKCPQLQALRLRRDVAGTQQSGPKLALACPVLRRLYLAGEFSSSLPSLARGAPLLHTVSYHHYGMAPIVLGPEWGRIQSLSLCCTAKVDIVVFNKSLKTLNLCQHTSPRALFLRAEKLEDIKLLTPQSWESDWLMSEISLVGGHIARSSLPDLSFLGIVNCFSLSSVAVSLLLQHPHHLCDIRLDGLTWGQFCSADFLRFFGPNGQLVSNLRRYLIKNCEGIGAEVQAVLAQVLRRNGVETMTFDSLPFLSRENYEHAPLF